MPNNFLSNDESIQGKWGAPPKLDAPNIAGVLGEILQQKRWQQAQTQKALADTIRNVREERQSAEYLDAMKAAGLVPQEYDAGGLGGATLAGHLAKQIEAQKLADARAGLIGAQTDKVNTVAEAIRSGNYGTGRSRGGGYDVPDEPETYTDPQGRVWQKTRTGWKTLPVGLQPTDTRTQNENQMLKEQAGLLEQKGIMDADVAREKAANETLNKPDVPYSKSDQYNRMVNRLKQIQQMKSAPSVQPDAATQPAPAETGDALPTSTPIPNGKGADKNLAPGYGVPAATAPSRDKAVAGQKYYAPDGTVRVRGDD